MELNFYTWIFNALTATGFTIDKYEINEFKEYEVFVIYECISVSCNRNTNRPVALIR